LKGEIILIGRVLDVTDRVRNTKRKKREAKGTIHTGAAKCLGAKGGIFENFLKENVTAHYIKYHEFKC